MSDEHPWRDAELLERLYLGEHMSTREIGEQFGCSKTTILNWLDRHGIDKQPYDDPELLHELYWGKNLSTAEIGERFGLTAAGVRVVMDRHGIPTRDGSEAQRLWGLKRHPYFGLSYNGYEVIQTKLDGQIYRVYHHRLLAVAKYGVEALDGMTVHHRNGIPWDNRPSNIELLSPSEHTRKHHEQGDYGDYEWLKGDDSNE